MNKKEWLAGLAILGACALCCALPLLGAAAVLGISSFFLNPVVLVISTGPYHSRSRCLSTPKGKWNIMHEAGLRLHIMHTREGLIIYG